MVLKILHIWDKQELKEMYVEGALEIKSVRSGEEIGGITPLRKS